MALDGEDMLVAGDGERLVALPGPEETSLRPDKRWSGNQRRWWAMGDLLLLRHNTNTAERALLVVEAVVVVVVVLLTLAARGEESLEATVRERKGDNAAEE